MSLKNVALIVLGTNNYFPLAINLIDRLNYFYKGDAKLTFHFVADKDPSDYLSSTNVIFHHRDADTWDKSTVLKLDMCKEIATQYDYDHIGCLDADSNIFRNFTEKEIFAEVFVIEHRWNSYKQYYEKNPLSSAYVDPSEYQTIYFQTCYFGGTREKMLEMAEFAIELRTIDSNNGIIAEWTDEGYLQKYLMKSHNLKIFNPHSQENFPIFIDDKGDGRDKFLTGKTHKPFENFSNEQYQNMMKKIALLKNKNLLWNIYKNEIVIESPIIIK
jgi:hypothetical protein